MLINNAMKINGVNIPNILNNKICVVSCCSLHKNELFLFNIALELVANQILIDESSSSITLTSLNIIFTKSNHISIDMEDSELGTHSSLAIYNIASLRYFGNERFMLFTFIEEMTHHFWLIEDETKVKYKVIEIMKRYDKDISIEIVKGWKLYGFKD